MVKALARHCKLLHCHSDVPLHLPCLARNARPGPTTDLLPQPMPHETCSHHCDRRMVRWVGQSMNDVENPATPGSRDNGLQLPHGNVAQDSNAGATQQHVIQHQTRNCSSVGLYLHNPQLRRSQGGVIYARGHVEDGLISWAGQGIGNQVTFACNVADVGCEFGDCRELTLLPNGPGIRNLSECKVEGLKAPHYGRPRKVANGLDSVRECNSTLLRHVVAQKVDGTEAELAFVGVDNETMLAEVLAQQMELGAMFLLRVTSHEDIVHVNEKEIESLTHGVHQALEVLRGVLKAEGHMQEHKQTKVGDFSRFGHILLTDGNLVLQSLILKLQTLQKKAVQDDDYEKADKFNKKLAELKREQSSLKFQLPSYHPCIVKFLQKLELQLQFSEHQNDCIFNKNEGNFSMGSNEDKYSDSNYDNLQISWSRRSQLIQDRQEIQSEIADIKERLALLEARDHQLSREIEEGSRLIELCDSELISLPTTSPSELHDLHKTLEDVLPLRNKVLLNAELPEDIKSLQRREHMLSMAIKTAASKVCSSQKLCSNFGKKVSDIETQLLTLLEAKMLAISGHEFSTAKDCAKEIKSLTSNKARLEEIINDLQGLISSNSQQLEAIKGDYSSLKTELEQEESLFENNQRESIIKYMAFLEDKLHSCGTHLFEKVWEADLETCQLFIRGLHLKEPSYHACEEEEYRTGEEDEAIEVACSDIKDTGDVFPCKQDGHNVQCFVPDQKEIDSSEIRMKYFLSTKSSQSKVAYKDSAVDIREQCEGISDRLVRLEEQLQVAVNNHDDRLTHILLL
ncbi:disrupted in schizophrenia 1 protein-like [Rhinoraja longicauda]